MKWSSSGQGQIVAVSDEDDDYDVDVNTCVSTYHSSNSWGLFRTVATILPPWFGGFEYIPLTIRVSWDLTATKSLTSFTTIVKLPTRSSITYYITYKRNKTIEY